MGESRGGKVRRWTDVPLQLVLIYLVIFKENKFVSIIIVGGPLPMLLGAIPKARYPRQLLIKAHSGKYVVCQIYKEVLFWSCLVDKNGREVQGRLP
jgi:hypothetical protein